MASILKSGKIVGWMSGTSAKGEWKKYCVLIDGKWVAPRADLKADGVETAEVWDAQAKYKTGDQVKLVLAGKSYQFVED